MNPIVSAALNKLCKWRSIYTGRILGTRSMHDAQAKGVRDVFEKLLIQRVELSALTQLLIAKGAFTLAEFEDQLVIEARALDKAIEHTFPGFRTTETGVEIHAPVVAQDTTRGWPA